VPAGFAVGNGYGKFMGSTQIMELGEIETPILLTNTLNVPEVASGIVDWTLRQPGNEEVRSVNAIVGETNDGFLNDIRARRVTRDHALAAIAAAQAGPVTEGSVGAGTGTIAFGWKGGIGTSSRRLPPQLGGWTVGVLVQDQLWRHPRRSPAFRSVARSDSICCATSFGGVGRRVGDRRHRDRCAALRPQPRAAGAPRLHRHRRTGSPMTNGSGDYAIAFSTNEAVRRTAGAAKRDIELRGGAERAHHSAVPGGGRGDRGSGDQLAVRRRIDGRPSGPDRGTAVDEVVRLYRASRD
jgi:D-aminopeptidase